MGGSPLVVLSAETRALWTEQLKEAEYCWVQQTELQTATPFDLKVPLTGLLKGLNWAQGLELWALH